MTASDFVHNPIVPSLKVRSLDHPQLVPLFHVDRLVEVQQQVPDALDDPIDPNILLQRIGPREIVIAVIGRPPDQSAAHIRIALNG